MTERKIIIPYRPRYPQGEIHSAMDSHRFCVLVAHRRMGKTVLAINQLIKRALLCPLQNGQYGYIAPFLKQAKAVAWGYLKHYTAPIPDTKVNESELSISLPNSSSIRLFGADNPDAMRGMYLDGCIMDEVAQMKTEMWGEIVRPALADRNGWAVFIGTPKGVNLFSDTYDKALEQQMKGNDDWCAMMYSIDQTKAIPDNEVAALREEMSEAEFRQEFLCDFAAAADNALIPIELARTACTRVYRESEYTSAPLVFGVDVARFGNDASVIFKRRGLVALEPVIVRKFDNMQLADMIARMIHEDQPDAVFIDAGQGQGVIDRLRQLRMQVTEVPFGSAALDSEHYLNRRIEMWDGMAKWLREGGAIPPSAILQADLCAPTYGYNLNGKKLLEPKDKIKERIGRSTDLADALALTFASPVRPKISQRFADQIYGRNERYDPSASFDEQWRSM